MIPVRRTPVVLQPDLTRIVARPFLPGDGPPVDGRTRLDRLVERVLTIPPYEAAALLADVRERFAARHQDLTAILDQGYENVVRRVDVPRDLTIDQRGLLGAYATHEYAIEAAALTNPSLVRGPDQSGLVSGQVRVVVTLRAVGEGHISSIEFRTAVLEANGDVTVDPPEPPQLGIRQAPVFDRAVFEATLAEIAPHAGRGPGGTERRRGPVERALDRLEQRYSLEELEAVLADLAREQPVDDATALALKTVHWLATSNYDLQFPASSDVSSRVVFPTGPAESRGMEDMRLAEFVDDDGRSSYLGTYTAYDGFHVLPQLIASDDLVHFRIATLTGAAARNKGIAVFPRRIDGRYAALARSDNENNYLMFSDHPRIWATSHRIQVPVRPWELLQIGNCGSPLETDAGWLVVTHGVGPMRTYALGALLLDRDDPLRVIGHLPEPLLVPDDEERDGYVPNVVYSCGQILHEGRLVLAYGASDTVTRFASVAVDDLLTALTSPAASG